MARRRVIYLGLILLLTACSKPSVIKDDQVFLVDHHEDKTYELTLSEDGVVDKKEVKEETESDQEKDSKKENNGEKVEDDDLPSLPLNVDLAQAKAEYDQRYFDAAAASLKKLVEASDDNDQAADLLTQVRQAQLRESRRLLSSSLSQERQSELVKKQCEQDLGQSIAEVPDQELDAWLQASSFTFSSDEMDVEEKEVVDQLAKVLQVDLEDKELVVFPSEQETYIEVRELEEVDNMQVSDLLGIFKYSQEDQSFYYYQLLTERYEKI